MVIDHLFDDKTSLASCSLVSRAWLRTARYHLFDSIYVHCEKDADAFQKFLEYLETTPSIRAYIKDVCFDGYREASLDVEEGFEDTLDSAYLAAVTALLPEVHSYTFINCQWGRSENGPPAQSTVPLRSLHINSFVAASENSQNKLRILRHFSRIEHLHLENMWLGHFGFDEHDKGGTDGDVAATLPETRVKALSLSMANICLNFLEYLRIQPFMKSLQSFRVADLFHAEYLEEHQDLVFVGELLRDRLSTTLKDFTMELPRLVPGDSADLYNQLNLASCQDLTNVVLRMPMRRGVDESEPENTAREADADPVASRETPTSGRGVSPTTTKPGAFNVEEWRAPLVIISQLPASTKSIFLDVELDGPNDMVYSHLRAFPDWQKLDNILTQLPALERFSLRRIKEQEPYTTSWTKAQHDLIARKLPLLREKKLLVCQWHSAVQ